MNRFDELARSWDENPMHLDRSKHVAQKMGEMLPLHNKMSALEYGAGTGILSFLLSEQLAEIAMMDNSAEMVKVMQEKASKRGVINVLPIQFNLETADSAIRYDLIFNQMVLHHISDVQAIFTKFYSMLMPGGFLAIADLYPEDGSFHGGDFDGHLGFDPLQLKQQLINAGFNEAKYETCYTVERKQPDGNSQFYPIFLIVASRD